MQIFAGYMHLRKYMRKRLSIRKQKR